MSAQHLVIQVEHPSLQPGVLVVPGTVTINGVSSLLIDGCVVDHKYGAVTFGGWEAALRSRAALEAER